MQVKSLKRVSPRRANDRGRGRYPVGGNDVGKPMPWQERFWMYVSQGDPDECWEWKGVRTPEGHGRLSIDGNPAPAHRLSVSLHGREIPAGLEVHHLCENPPCINPSHLEVVTRAEHKKRHRRTHCHRGHLLAESAVSESDRRCLTCINARRRQKRAQGGMREFDRHRREKGREIAKERRAPLVRALREMTKDGSSATAQEVGNRLGMHRLSAGRSLTAAYRDGTVERIQVAPDRYEWRAK